MSGRAVPFVWKNVKIGINFAQLFCGTINLYYLCTGFDRNWFL